MDPEKRLRARKALEKRGISLAGAGQAAKTLGGGLWKSLPVIGNLWSGGSAAYNLYKGNFGDAALDAAGMIPGVGNYVTLGRTAYDLGKGSGAAQAQAAQPQQPPRSPQYNQSSPIQTNYGARQAMGPMTQGAPQQNEYGHPKYAGLCDRSERTNRGLAFEIGVERFCKEASFDEDDRKALYRLMLKKGGWGGEPVEPLPNAVDEANDKGVPIQNNWLNFRENPHMGWLHNQFNRVMHGMSGPNGGIGKLVDAPMTSWHMDEDQANQQRQREEDYAKNPSGYRQQYVDHRTTGKANNDLNRRMEEAKGQADIMMKRHPGMSRGRAAAMTMGGFGAEGRDMMRDYRNEGKAPKGPAQFGSSVPGGGGPAQAPAVPGAAPQTIQGGTGYFTGTPPAQAASPAAGGGGAGGFGANPMKPAAPARKPGAGIYMPQDQAKEFGIGTTASAPGQMGKVYNLPFGYGADRSVPEGNQGGDASGKGVNQINPPPGMRVPANDAAQAGLYTGSHGQVMPGGNPGGQVGMPGANPPSAPSAMANEAPAATPPPPAPAPAAPSLKSPALASILSTKATPAAPAAPKPPAAPAPQSDLVDDITGEGTRGRTSADVPDITPGPLASPPPPAAPAAGGYQQANGIMAPGDVASKHKMTSQELSDTMSAGQAEAAKAKMPAPKAPAPKPPAFGTNPLSGGGVGGSVGPAATSPFGNGASTSLLHGMDGIASGVSTGAKMLSGKTPKI